MSRIGSQVPVQTTQQTQATEGAGNAAKVKDFFVSLGKGIAKAAGAVANFFTETLPNAFKSLTARTAQEGTAPTTARGAEQTAPKEKGPRTKEGFLGGPVPSGLQVDEHGSISGEVTLTHTSTNTKDWS